MSHGTLLVVDDDETLRSLLVSYFRERGTMDVDVARDGAEALHCISRKHYELVVLDLIMPHMTGVDVLDSLKARLLDPSLNAREAPPSVLIITGTPQEDFSASAIESRCPNIVRGVLRKPVDLRELDATIDRLLPEATRG